MYKIILKLKNKLENSNGNNKTIIFNAMGAFVIKGGALIISLFTMPAYFKYFNNQETLGLWFTILSVLAWILAFDLGIGNGLRNKLVPTFVKKNHLDSKKYISSAYLTIGILVFSSIFLSTLVFKFINWNIIFNISESMVSREILNVTVLIVFSGIMLQFLFKLINSVLYALQKSALNNFLSLLTSIIVFIYVSFVDSSNIASDLVTLAIVHVLAVNVPLIIATILLFSSTLKESRPNFKYFRRKYAKEIIMLGGVFFWIQIMYMILTATNEFLITWLTEPKMVVEYQIYYKIFTLFGAVFTIGLTPIWSAVTKALEEKDYIWIKKLYKILTWSALSIILIEFLTILFLQVIIDIWLGENTVHVNYFYATVFALSGSMIIWIGVLSTITNGFGMLKIQSIFYTIGVLIKIPLSFYLVGVLNSWIGVILANIIALSLFCIVQPIYINKFLNSKLLGDEKNV